MSKLGAFLDRAGLARPLLLTGGFLAALCGGFLGSQPFAAEQPRALPAPALNPAVTASVETAVFAGGCFWGTQGVFQRVTGVKSVEAGYAGGTEKTATYELTETGTTNHAEAIRITFDPHKVSYGTLLQVFFSVAHDPTQLNRQGSDVGTQYRSAIFPVSADQGKIASAYIDQLASEGAFSSKIVTTIEPGKDFFRAEAYHQNYLINNPTQPYIAFVEQPKVDALKAFFPEVWSEKPAPTADQRS
jgi:peptide-methionine (S)-S-oxide reductase